MMRLDCRYSDLKIFRLMENTSTYCAAYGNVIITRNESGRCIQEQATE